MKLNGRRGRGLRGVLALAFIAAALAVSGGVYAFTRATAGDVAVAPSSAVLALEKKAPEVVKPTEAPAPPAPTPKVEEKADATARTWVADGDAALARGEWRAGLLKLRKAARARTASPEQTEARVKMAKLAALALDDAGKAKAKEDLQGEREALTRAFFATLEKEARKPLIARLEELARKTTLSARFTADGDVYTVKQGDRLIAIARANKTTWSFIKRVNDLKTDAIRVGQKLKIPRGTIELAVFKTDFQLVVTIDGLYVRSWDVGTGREDRTPETTFKIAERLEKPTWYAPDGKVYPFGAKENILGTRWMGFEKTEEHVGFGIHGTAFPETIGTESSAGCIRMRNEEVEELYDFVAEGTLVDIVR